MREKDIQITPQSKVRGVEISRHGVAISHQHKPVSGILGGTGNVFLLLDCSGSMAGEKIRQAKKGALAFARDALATNYSVGLIKFDSSASHLCEPTRRIELLEQCIDQIELGDETHMAKAITLAHQQLKSQGTPQAMVVVTDGVPNGPGDPEASLKAGENSKNDGIDIITIGTDGANQQFLKRLASRSELGMKVSRQHFEESIASSAKLLPSGSTLTKTQ